MILPSEATPLLLALAPTFTAPTYRRFVLLLAAALLTTGRRTIANLLRTLGPLAEGDRTSFQWVLSAAQWSGLQLACLLTRFLVRTLLPNGVITLAGDDTWLPSGNWPRSPAAACSWRNGMASRTAMPCR